MEKRYQVFVSSTYEDLQDERREVMLALLKTKCIPTGMELFPAADNDSLTHIKRFIAQCDYYIVIVAGRYGSLGPDDKSFTELEYDFAKEAHVPVLAFLHGDPSNIPAGKTEATDKGKMALQTFRDKIKASKHVNSWTTPKDLAGSVCLSMMSAIELNPRPGWVHGDKVPEDAAQEIVSLSHKVMDLKSQVEKLATSPPPNTEKLSQGEETVEVTFEGQRHSSYAKNKMAFTWNELLTKLGPIMLNEATELDMKHKLLELFSNKRADQPPFTPPLYDASVRDEDFQRVKIQLLALGLTMKAESAGYWTLTPYGIHRLTQVAAIPAQKERSDQ
jgi:Domain of unknown function (DUF4062)